MVIKADSLNFYKRPTRFAVLKTDSQYFCKFPTRIVGLKTDCLYFNKALIPFAVLKN